MTIFRRGKNILIPAIYGISSDLDHTTMGHILHTLLALLASCSQQELARQVAYLQEENRILRARLPKRIVAPPRERRRLIRAGRGLGDQLKELMSFVRFQTFQRWIRQAEQSRATTKSAAARTSGRPKTPDEIRSLILRMRKETNFGYTWLMGELRKLGIKVSRQTVKNILREAGFDLDPNDGFDSWGAFLKRHANTLWQCDFATKRMWTSREWIDFYFLVFLHLGTRRCWISPCTASPHSEWISQRGRNFLIVAEEMELAPTIVMRDNDAKYSKQFDEVFTAVGIDIKRTVPMSPNLRAHVERFIQSLKHECLNKFVVVGEKHLNHINRQWQLHYNQERPHSARDHLPPDRDDDPPEEATIRIGDIVCHTRLGGLLKSYERRAA